MFWKVIRETLIGTGFFLMTCSLLYVAGILLILAFMFITRDILPMGLGWALVFIIVSLLILPLAGVFTYKFMRRRNGKDEAGSHHH